MQDPSQQVPWQRTLYILLFAQLMVAVGFSSIFPFLPLYVEQLGSSSGMSIELLSGLVYSAQAFAMMIASPLWGALADRFGRKLISLRSPTVQNAAQTIMLLLFMPFILLQAVVFLLPSFLPQDKVSAYLARLDFTSITLIVLVILLVADIELFLGALYRFQRSKLIV